ncbi:MAG TPA: chloride channel protein [Chitinophagaceae bacterium]|nr:chloride channel protein [Chitinophagaceae bacterium]
MKSKNYVQFLKQLLQVGKKGQGIIHYHGIPLEFIHRRLSRTQFLILSGILVGCSGGLAGVLLKFLVHYIHQLITKDYHFHYQLLFYFIFPITGILLTVAVVKYLFRGKDDKGIPRVLHEIARKSSFVAPQKMYSQIIQSAITVGFGGSAGLESPIAVTGAALGSNFARTYRLDYRERTLLLAAGAAAGIASAFDAPVAGVMFAIEILLSGVVFSDFIPLIIASACGALLSKIILNDQILLHFNLKQPFNYRNIPFYILLGVICGIYSRYYAIVSIRVDRFFHRFENRAFSRGLTGGLILSMLCFLFPPLFGDGYGYVKILANGGASDLIKNSLFGAYHTNTWVILGFIGLICLVKVLATTVTISGGGNGGNFAPSLFAGAFLGYFFALAAGLSHIAVLPLANFAIVAMAGVMSGVLYAPLTSIFLIAEVTGGYDLFIPLMIVSTSSYLIVKKFSTYSVDTSSMASRGDIFTQQADRNLLSLLQVTDLLEKDVLTISPDALLRDLVGLVKKSHRSLFGVVNGQQELCGIIVLDDIREVMFNTELYDTEISQLMKAPPAYIDVSEDMALVMKKFDETQAWNLPVLQHNTFLGFISKSVLLNSYRNLLRDYSASSG